VSTPLTPTEAARQAAANSLNVATFDFSQEELNRHWGLVAQAAISAFLTQHGEGPSDEEILTSMYGEPDEAVIANKALWTASAAKALAAKEGEKAELQATFDLQWKADQRAIKQWREAHPGNDLVWPDRCNMVVWLMDRVAALAAKDAEIAVSPNALMKQALVEAFNSDLRKDRDALAKELHSIKQYEEIKHSAFVGMARHNNELLEKTRAFEMIKQERDELREELNK